MATKMIARRLLMTTILSVILLLAVGATLFAAPPGSSGYDDDLIRQLKKCKQAAYRNDPLCLPAKPGVTGDVLPAVPLLAATPGYTVNLNPSHYHKGLYVSYHAQGSAELRAHVMNLLETTELNAVVLDVKGDRGFIVYPTGVEMAHQIGAAKPVLKAEDWPAWRDWLKARNVYLIARIVTFKDEPLAVAHPEWAVQNFETGGIWRDRENLGWGDPTRREVWDYNIALAVEAAQQGFDEIQFDYVRFPSDGNLKQIAYSIPVSKPVRMAHIGGFLAAADEALAPYDVKIAADVFGYVPWRTGDMGIGQHVETIAPYLDVLSPMLYPSTFADGLPGLPAYTQSIAFPYEIVNETTKLAVARGKAVNPELEVRPWIQDFSDYQFDRRTYTPDEMRRQMDGAREAGGRGWLLWDPRVRYTTAALVSAGPVFAPNTAGIIPIIPYTALGRPQGRSLAKLQTDLVWLLRQGFYPVYLSDVQRGDLSMVPAGKRPVALVLHNVSEADLAWSPAGGLSAASGLGALWAFHQTYPADFPLRVTLFVDAQGDTLALSPASIDYLTGLGFVIEPQHAFATLQNKNGATWQWLSPDQLAEWLTTVAPYVSAGE